MFKLIKLLIFLAIIAVAGVMFLPLGSVEFKDPELTAPLVIPVFSMFKGETGNYVANFETLRSSWALEQEFEKILKDNYINHTCDDGAVVYFDQKNYITIYGFTVEQDFPLSKYSIEYGRGNQCEK